MFGDARIRTGHLMVGMVKTPSLRNALLGISRHFDAVKSDTLTDQFAQDRQRLAGRLAWRDRRLDAGDAG